MQGNHNFFVNTIDISIFAIYAICSKFAIQQNIRAKGHTLQTGEARRNGLWVGPERAKERERNQPQRLPPLIHHSPLHNAA